MFGRVASYVLAVWIASNAPTIQGIPQAIQFGDRPVRSEHGVTKRVASSLASSSAVARLQNSEMDVIVPVHQIGCVAEKAVERLNRHFGPRRILVATNVMNCPQVERYAPNVLCFDEDALLPGLTKRNVALRIHELREQTNRRRKPVGESKVLNMQITGNGGHSLAGWWLQQFVKLGFSTTPLLKDPPLSETFLVWDSDMILMDRFDAFNVDGTMPLMAGGKAHAAFEDSCPYGYSFHQLVGHMHASAPGNRGYIPHHMVMHKRFLTEMLQAFQGESNSEWFWRLVDTACSSDDMSRCTCGFSEYNSYATWVKTHHPEAVADVAENFTRITGPDACCPLQENQLLDLAHNKKKGDMPVLFVGLEQGGCTGHK